MEWFTANWFWVLIFIAFIAMHLFGHGGHGGNGSMEMALPAFKWLTFCGFCLGLIESFLYGVYAGLVFVPIYNFLTRRWGVPAKQ